MLDSISSEHRIELAPLVEKIRQIGAEKACIDFYQAFALAFPYAKLELVLDLDSRHRTTPKNVSPRAQD